MQTIPQKFNETVNRFAKRPALKFKYQGVYISLSFIELQRRVNTMARGLLALGVNQGDRVAILSENRSEWVRTDLAALTIGAITVPVHTTLSPIIIQHIIADSGSSVLFVSNQEQFNKILLVANNLPNIKTIIYINLDSSINHQITPKLLSLDEVMKLGKNSTRELNRQIAPDDVASIVYTSGTTALPKGVMLTHHNFLYDAEAAVTAVPVDEHDTLLSFLPLSHVLERTCGYYAPLICRGSCIAYAENMSTLKTNLKEIRPTIIVSVPRVFEKIHSQVWDQVKTGNHLKYQLFIWALKQEPNTFLHHVANRLVFKKIKSAFGGRLRLAISGGATLNHKLARFFGRIGIKIVEGYGLTETSPVIACNRPDNVKFGTVGNQLPGVEIKIAADKEILTRGPNLMKGYYQNEALTKEMIDSDGWLHTGDLGFLSSDGFLVIIGRKKEMISLSSGKIVWPEQLEIILNNDRLIGQSMVYGDKKSFITALIVPDWVEVLRLADENGVAGREPDQLIKDEKIISIFTQRLEKINDQLADWEKVRKFVLLPADFSADKDEVTPTLKLRRNVIADHFKNELSQLY